MKPPATRGRRAGHGALALALALTLVAESVAAQEQPRFSGVWVLDATRKDARDVSWGPRRGGPTSSQPITRARNDGERLVLAKSPGESYGHVWVWTLGADGSEIQQRETLQSWNADFDAHPPERGRTYHRQATRDDSGAFVAASPGLAQAVPEVQNITVRVAADMRDLLVRCPEYACTSVRLESGVRSDSIPLPRGETARIPVPSEVIIQPAPQP